MRHPMELVERGTVLTSRLRAEIEERMARLDHFYARIVHCRATAEGPGRHHRKGMFTLRLAIAVPGRAIVIARQAGEEPREAIREAFAAAERRIEDYIRRARHFVKTHEGRAEARVSRLFPDRGYGFLATADGREIYFHRNCVLRPGFDRLVSGSWVRYREETGGEGPQATMVVAIRKPRRSGNS